MRRIPLCQGSIGYRSRLSPGPVRTLIGVQAITPRVRLCGAAPEYIHDALRGPDRLSLARVPLAATFPLVVDRLKELVRVGSCRHGIKQSLNLGKGAVQLVRDARCSSTSPDAAVFFAHETELD